MENTVGKAENAVTMCIPKTSHYEVRNTIPNTKQIKIITWHWNCTNQGSFIPSGKKSINVIFGEDIFNYFFKIFNIFNYPAAQSLPGADFFPTRPLQGHIREQVVKEIIR